MKPVLMEHFLVRPVLTALQVHNERMLSDASVQLIMGTIAQESDFGKFNRQHGNGPAKGFCQVEPFTEQDVRKRYLDRHPVLLEAVLSLINGIPENPSDDYFAFQLEVNPFYCIAIARVKYWMVSEPMPAAGDLLALGRYWDKYYNGNPLKGTPKEWVHSYGQWITESNDK